MRIRKIEINNWRNFKGVTIELPDTASLVCLVGANGTGKTHILELISACAHHIGLSAGIEIPRGNPFEDTVRDFSVEFYLARGVSAALDKPIGDPAAYAKWDRTITLKGNSKKPFAGGVPDAGQATTLGSNIVNALRSSADIHHLVLDADRAFPKKTINSNQLAEAYETKWDDANYSKGRAFQPTRTMYDEWIKYCLARENKAANKLYQEARRAHEAGMEAPAFEDIFETYRKSLRQVMPHLLFSGVDTEKKAILFDTAGMQLRFDQLSGGEREISFLIGQIDRFGLRNGLFLLDEPELHLNPDLVRDWVTYLGNTVATGQVWLATHSLEAVEAAGLNSTILLERDESTRVVSSVGSLAQQPVLTSLSRAVGTPAFSISELRFVFIEGEEQIGERERYRKVTGLGTDTRFIECGSCSEVIRRLSTINGIAKEANQNIRIVGVIDKDWRSKAELDSLTAHKGLVALPVHEIENFFLHKETLSDLAGSLGQKAFDYDAVLLKACDERAGGWIIQSALSDESQRDISNLPGEARSLAYKKSWAIIEPDIDAAMEEIGSAAGFEPAEKTKLVQRLTTFAKIYQKKRAGPDLWKVCEGKEVMKAMAKALNFTGHHALEQAVVTYWNTDPIRLPAELAQFRSTLNKA